MTREAGRPRVLWEGNVVCLEDAMTVRFRFRFALLEEQLLAARLADNEAEEHAVAMKICRLVDETRAHVRRMWKTEASAKKMADEVRRRARARAKR